MALRYERPCNGLQLQLQTAVPRHFAAGRSTRTHTHTRTPAALSLD